MNQSPHLEKLLQKIEALKKTGQVDLSMEEDLSLAVANLISLEEHSFMSGVKTGKDEYFKVLLEAREIRKELLQKLVPRHEGETWCASKHLLAATIRLMEVGTKLKSQGKDAEAKKVFDYGYRLFTIFWALRLKLLRLPALKKAAKDEKVPWSLQDIMNKLVDCCDET